MKLRPGGLRVIIIEIYAAVLWFVELLGRRGLLGFDTCLYNCEDSRIRRVIHVPV